MTWAERMAVGMVVTAFLTPLAVGVWNFLTGYMLREWLRWRLRRPELGSPDFRASLAAWEARNPRKRLRKAHHD